MSRIRSVHPGLFTDEAFMELTVAEPLAAALFIGLWTEADDSGAFEWKPVRLKARLLPATSVDVERLLAAIESVDSIRRFEIDGKTYGVIRNFVKYQRPKDPRDIHPLTAEARNYAGFDPDGSRPRSGTGRPSTRSKSEPVPNDFGSSSEPVPNDFGDWLPEEGGRREDVGGRKDSLLQDAARGAARQNKQLELISENAEPSDADERVASEAGIDSALLRSEWRRFVDFNRSRGKRVTDISAAWRLWVSNYKPNQRAGPQAVSAKPSCFKLSKPALNI